ncbi:MAG: hypothetical protein HGA61_03615 [Candidatus Moranbacteria bacterium]|nr:hypothetical protein [Candidatus Moranbacteria bacterium]
MEGEFFKPEDFFEKRQNAKIRLEFFRHDEKDPATGMGNDNEVRISKEGQRHAIEVGEEKNSHPEVALVYGSPRKRSVETAYAQMLSEDEIKGLSLEEIREKVSENISFGTKEIVTNKLNFDWSGSEEFKKTAEDHYLNKKDALKFLFEESDALVRELNDTKSIAYSRAASNVAQIIEKYAGIFDGWEKITNNNKEKYEKFGNELQRFLGSHGTVLECFLMKVIEKIEGKDRVIEFLDSLEDKNQFNFSQGFSVVIEKNAGNEKTIKVTFENKSWILKPEMLKEIVAGG